VYLLILQACEGWAPFWLQVSMAHAVCGGSTCGQGAAEQKQQAEQSGVQVIESKRVSSRSVLR
jgi:hypothetical protein